MTDMDPKPESSPAATETAAPKAGLRNRGFLLAAAVSIGLVVAGAAAVASGIGSHRGGHHGLHRGGPERISFATDRALAFVDATPEQSEKIRTIVDRTVNDLAALRDEVEADRANAIALLRGPTIDRAAVEKFRADRIARIDAQSRQVTASILEVAETLTPDQRAKLADELGRLQERFRPPFAK